MDTHTGTHKTPASTNWLLLLWCYMQLYGNPLDYLPELGPAVGLRSLSLANVRILADAAYSRWGRRCVACSMGLTSPVCLLSLITM
jgi:hypothetical protein